MDTIYYNLDLIFIAIISTCYVNVVLIKVISEAVSGIVARKKPDGGRDTLSQKCSLSAKQQISQNVELFL